MLKNILLSPEAHSVEQGNMPRGILTVEQGSGEIKCKLRTYNVMLRPNETAVGIYFRGAVKRAVLKPWEKGSYTFESYGEYDLSDDIYFALISDGRVDLCGGTYADSIVDIKQVFFNKDAATAQPDIDRAADIEMPLHKQEDVTIDDYFRVDKAQTSEDTDYDTAVDEDITEFFMTKNVAKSMDNIERQTHTKPQNTPTFAERDDAVSGFFEQVSGQFDEIFKVYPSEERLNAIVPDSDFVRIDDDSNGSFYVLGIMKISGKVKYLAYGLPAAYNADPPEEMNGRCQWLPLEPLDPLSDGYYILYQDADTGEVVNIDIS